MLPISKQFIDMKAYSLTNGVKTEAVPEKVQNINQTEPQNTNSKLSQKIATIDFSKAVRIVNAFFIVLILLMSNIAFLPISVKAAPNSVSTIEVDKTGILSDTNNDGIPQAGEVINYQFTVKNTGPTDLKKVELVDSKVAVVGATIETLKFDASDATNFKATYVLTAADIAAGSVENTAIVSAIDLDGKVITNSSNDPKTTTPNDATVVNLSSTPTVLPYSIDSKTVSGTCDAGSSLEVTVLKETQKVNCSPDGTWIVTPTTPIPDNTPVLNVKVTQTGANGVVKPEINGNTDFGVNPNIMYNAVPNTASPYNIIDSPNNTVTQPGYQGIMPVAGAAIPKDTTPAADTTNVAKPCPTPCAVNTCNNCATSCGNGCTSTPNDGKCVINNVSNANTVNVKGGTASVNGGIDPFSFIPIINLNNVFCSTINITFGPITIHYAPVTNNYYGTKPTTGNTSVTITPTLPTGAKIVTINGLPIKVGETITLPNGDKATLNADGTITVTRADTTKDSVIIIGYTSTDGTNNVTTILIPNSSTSGTNNTITIKPTLPTGSTLTTINGQAITVGQTITFTNGDKATLNADGTITYVKADGTKDTNITLGYTNPAGNGTTNIVITGTPAPAGTTTVTVTPSLPSNSTIVTINGAPIKAGETITLANGDKVTLNSDGTITIVKLDGTKDTVLNIVYKTLEGTTATIIITSAGTGTSTNPKINTVIVPIPQGSTITTINGIAITPGQTITLANGDKVTLNFDGTITVVKKDSNDTTATNLTIGYTLPTGAPSTINITVAATGTGTNTNPGTGTLHPNATTTTIAIPQGSTITTINGIAITPGQTITLPNGDKITLNNDGTITIIKKDPYDNTPTNINIGYTNANGSGTVSATVSANPNGTGNVTNITNIYNNGTTGTTGPTTVNVSPTIPAGSTITTINGQAIAPGQTIILANGDKVTLNTNGTLTIVKADGSKESVLNVGYTNSNGTTSTILVQLPATPSTTTPTTVPNITTVSPNLPTGAVVITINGQTIIPGQTITLPNGDKITLNFDGTITVVKKDPLDATPTNLTLGYTNPNGTTSTTSITVPAHTTNNVTNNYNTYNTTNNNYYCGPSGTSTTSYSPQTPSGSSVTSINSIAIIAGQTITMANGDKVTLNANGSVNVVKVDATKDITLIVGYTNANGTTGTTTTIIPANACTNNPNGGTVINISNNNTNTNTNNTTPGVNTITPTIPTGYVIYSINGTNIKAGETITLPNGDKVTLNNDGTITVVKKNPTDSIPTNLTLGCINPNGNIINVNVTVSATATPTTNTGTNTVVPSIPSGYTIVTINGQPIKIGETIILPNGDKVTLNNDGTISVVKINPTDNLPTNLILGCVNPNGNTINVNITVPSSPTTNSNGGGSNVYGYIIGTNTVTPSIPKDYLITSINGLSIKAGETITLANGDKVTFNFDSSITVVKKNPTDGIPTNFVLGCVNPNTGQLLNVDTTVPANQSPTGTNGGTIINNYGNTYITNGITSPNGGTTTVTPATPIGSTITTINGQAIKAGETITLSNGDKITLNSDGTIKVVKADPTKDTVLTIGYTANGAPGTLIMTIPGTPAGTNTGGVTNIYNNTYNNTYNYNGTSSANGGTVSVTSCNVAGSTVTTINGLAIIAGQTIALPNGDKVTLSTSGLITVVKVDPTKDITLTIQSTNSNGTTANCSIAIPGVAAGTNTNGNIVIHISNNIPPTSTGVTCPLGINTVSTVSNSYGTITSIDGQAIVVGQTITLANGDKITLNSDGTLKIVKADSTKTTSYTVVYSSTNGASINTSIVVSGTTSTSTTITYTPSNPSGSVVTAINGTPISIGQTITLTNGDKLTLNANGTITVVKTDTTKDSTLAITFTNASGVKGTLIEVIQGSTATTSGVKVTIPTLPIAGTINTINGQLITAGQTITLASGEKVTLNFDGTITVVKKNPADTTPTNLTIGYTTTSGIAATSTMTVPADNASVCNQSSNSGTTVINNYYTTNNNGSTAAQVVITVAQALPANATITSINGLPIKAGETVTLANGDKVTLNANGTLTVVKANPNDTTPTTITLGYTSPSGSGTVLITVTVPAVNPGSTISSTVNPNVPAGAKITDINGTPIVIGQTITTANGDKVTLNANGTITVVKSDPTQDSVLNVGYQLGDGTKGTIIVTIPGTTTANSNGVSRLVPAIPAGAKVTSIDGVAIVVGQTITLPNGDQVTLNADGSITVVKKEVTQTKTYEIGYTLADGTTGSIPVTIPGTAGTNNSYTVNPQNPTGSNITTVNGIAISVGQTITLANGDKVTLNADGTLTVIKKDINSETILSVGYKNADGTEGSTITKIAALNGSSNSTFTSIVTNLPAGAKITSIDGIAIVVGQTVTLSNGDKVTLNDDGTLTVVKLDGSKDSTFKIGFTNLDGTTGVETMTIPGKNTVTTNTSYTITPSIPFGATITQINGQPIKVGETITLANGDKVTLNTNGTLTVIKMDPNSSSILSIGYKNADGSIGSTVVTIPGASQAPGSITFLPNIPAGATSLTIDGKSIAIGETIMLSNGDKVTLNADGTLTVVKKDGSKDTTFVLGYTNSDGSKGQTTITIPGKNSGTVANTLTFLPNTPSGSTITSINGLAISKGNTITLANGDKVTLNNDGTITLIKKDPNSNTTLTYSYTDKNGNNGTATQVIGTYGPLNGLTIRPNIPSGSTITSIDDIPITPGQTVTTISGDKVTLNADGTITIEKSNPLVDSLIKIGYKGPDGVNGFVIVTVPGIKTTTPPPATEACGGTGLVQTTLKPNIPNGSVIQTINGQPIMVGQTIVIENGDKVTLNADGTLTVVRASCSTDPENLTVTVKDINGNLITGNVTVMFRPGTNPNGTPNGTNGTTPRTGANQPNQVSILTLLTLIIGLSIIKIKELRKQK
jgi:flagellar basal body rod protein FlgF